MKYEGKKLTCFMTAWSCEFFSPIYQKVYCFENYLRITVRTFRARPATFFEVLSLSLLHLHKSFRAHIAKPRHQLAFSSPLSQSFEREGRKTAVDSLFNVSMRMRAGVSVRSTVRLVWGGPCNNTSSDGLVILTEKIKPQLKFPVGIFLAFPCTPQLSECYETAGRHMLSTVT